ncbi:hypothetical protein HMPREF7215_1547 [Pyramidobacter piscolens W5455]|uniref:Uncharacterized protein n=1 Tax=Pyramidobacter piscolens W5455 TaxID=352165 RepID=A0ABM9ZWZ2_9BACT|nr:hypothetical protein HMPREF7215_1547 [Pyramidobacter piscolens W5455]
MSFTASNKSSASSLLTTDKFIQEKFIMKKRYRGATGLAASPIFTAAGRAARGALKNPSRFSVSRLHK